MIIYNTTFLVTDKQYDSWLKWLKEKHIPFMLKCGFSHPQVAKVLTAEQNQDGSSVSVQFRIDNTYQLSKWDEQNAEKKSNELTDRFGNEVLSFSTILEIIE